MINLIYLNTHTYLIESLNCKIIIIGLIKYDTYRFFAITIIIYLHFIQISVRHFHHYIPWFWFNFTLVTFLSQI